MVPAISVASDKLHVTHTTSGDSSARIQATDHPCTTQDVTVLPMVHLSFIVQLDSSAADRPSINVDGCVKESVSMCQRNLKHINASAFLTVQTSVLIHSSLISHTLA
jgi:hypothetical protein